MIFFLQCCRMEPGNKAIAKVSLAYLLFSFLPEAIQCRVGVRLNELLLDIVEQKLSVAATSPCQELLG